MFKLVLAGGLAAVLAASCGGGKDDSPAPTATPKTAPAVTGTPASSSTTPASPAATATGVVPTATPTAATTQATPPATAAATQAAPTPTQPAAVPTSTPTTAPPQPKTLAVQLAPASFSPNTVTIAVGDTVQWIWNNGIPHTVTSRGGFTSDPAGIKTTGTYSFRFATAGTYEYYCEIHESDGMTGRVVVQ